MERITMIGAGTMGHGIAQVYAQHGFKVMLYDIQQEILDQAHTKIQNNLMLAFECGLISQNQVDLANDNIQYTTDLDEAIRYGEFVTEAIPEVLEMKWELFERIESIVSKETLIASNTSSLSLTQLASRVRHPERFVVTHYFNPAHLVPLVEVVGTNTTHQSTLQATAALLVSCGKKPVVLNHDIPGFIANRLQAAVLREALHLLNNQIASPADIDLALKAGPGFRWAFLGALETADFGGLDVWKHVTENLFPNLSQDTAPPDWFVAGVEQGNLGVKTGEGIFKYAETEIAQQLKNRDVQFINLLKIHQRTDQDSHN